ncbi:hepatitis A virus cellular receptor 1 homolog [Centroberyx affinis]|uniref:hepatitis A virus cellular receptor 1 homolog n=1 Tax=Centroberyx affinis TaxID=166261 RepID=UPI003A5C13C4
MLPLLLHTFTFICLLTACASAYMETVVGVAGAAVTLPCRSAAVQQGGVEVCWGRGEPTLFSCHNTLISADRAQVQTTSHRYSLSSSLSSGDVSLSIHKSRQSDSGFYHCRIQLPGLFNDQTFTVHLIIINVPAVASDPPPDNIQPSMLSPEAHVRPRTPHTPVSFTGRDATVERGSDITGDHTTGPIVAQVKISKDQVSPQQQLNRLESFVGNSVRLAFIVFIPALLLVAGYRVWSSKRRAEISRSLTLSDQEESSV